MFIWNLIYGYLAINYFSHSCDHDCHSFWFNGPCFLNFNYFLEEKKSLNNNIHPTFSLKYQEPFRESVWKTLWRDKPFGMQGAMVISKVSVSYTPLQGDVSSPGELFLPCPHIPSRYISHFKTQLTIQTPLERLLKCILLYTVYNFRGHVLSAFVFEGRSLMKKG